VLELKRELEPLLNLKVLIFARDSNPAVLHVIRGEGEKKAHRDRSYLTGLLFRLLEDRACTFGTSIRRIRLLRSHATTNGVEIRERARGWEIVAGKPSDPLTHEKIRPTVTGVAWRTPELLLAHFLHGASRMERLTCAI